MMLRLVLTLRVLPLSARRKGQGPKATPADKIQEIGLHFHVKRRDETLVDFHVNVRDGRPAEFQIAVVEIQQTLPMKIIIMTYILKTISETLQKTQESPLQLFQKTQGSSLQLPLIHHCRRRCGVGDRGDVNEWKTSI